MLNNFGLIRTQDSDSEWCAVDYNTDSLADTAWQSLTEFLSPAGGLEITKELLLASTAESQAINILSDCGATKLAHHVCEECGKYNGRQVKNLQKKIEKITKVKA